MTGSDAAAEVVNNMRPFLCSLFVLSIVSFALPAVAQLLPAQLAAAQLAVVTALRERGVDVLTTREDRYDRQPDDRVLVVRRHARPS